MANPILPEQEVNAAGEKCCAGCDGGCAYCLRTDTHDDAHVMPQYGTEHKCSAKCWCYPVIDYISDSGAQVWVHRDMN